MKSRFLFLIFFVGLNSLSAQLYSDVTEEVGLSHITYDPNQMSGGVSIIDFNNDGYEDIYLTGGRYSDHFYLNKGDGTFIDATIDTGADSMVDYYTVGVVAGDLDNDGFTDLFITTQQGQPNICLRNINGQYFKQVSSEAGFFGTKWSTSCTLGDVDLDGDLDLYVSNFVNFSGDPFFRNIISEEPNHFIENKDTWTFGTSELEFVGATDGCTLVSCFTDIDDDMDPDLYVVNDFGSIYTPNEVFLNDPSNDQMVERAEEYGMDVRMDGMGIAIGDVDGNGYFDYYLSNIGECPFFLTETGPVFNDGNLRYNVNDGLGFSWGTFFADLDNDSYLELFVAKGSISESYDPQFNKLYTYDPSIDNFRDISRRAGIDNPHKGRGAAYADLNNDGLLDLVVNNVRIKENNEGNALIYFNQGSEPGNYIKLKLEGTVSNRSGIGAQVQLFSGDRMLKREVTGGSSYLSNNSYIVHFGTGDMVIDSLVVLWPSGMHQSFNQVSSNSFYYLKETNDLQIYDYGNTTSTRPTVTSGKLFNLHVFPNPSRDQITFNINSVSLNEAFVFLYDGNGSMMVKKELKNLKPNTSQSLDITHIQPGVYYLCLNNSIRSQCEKVIVID
ncbi:MAG: T9SS type A sorting domain-containing protein [Saprospiraceae bacterium]|nr:T9SS type A sorting domain-containing protein [Saprospiraceae bacterium]